MYSAVLMLALTAGSEMVDHGRNRCNGCANGYGCSAVVCGGVVGHGCSIGHGCAGGNGCSVGHGCSGRRGLFGGGLFGGRGRGCHGCNGGVVCGGVVCHGGVVCNGGHVCHGGAPVCCGGAVVVPAVGGKPMPKSEPIPEPKKKTTQSAAPATIIVSLPTDARLFVDGSATTSTSARRTLVTPELAFGQTYVYTMRVEVVRDGQVQAQTQQVNVIGGQVANVQFNLSSQGVASR